MTSAVKVSAAGTRNLALCPNPKVGSADQCLPACGGLPLVLHVQYYDGVRGLSDSPEVVAVERLAGELAVPQDEVHLVINTG